MKKLVKTNLTDQIFNYIQEEKKDTLEFVMMSCYNTICNDFDKIEVKKYEGILTNILWYGMLNSTKELLRRTEKCKKVRI